MREVGGTKLMYLFNFEIYIQNLTKAGKGDQSNDKAIETKL